MDCRRWADGRGDHRSPSRRTHGLSRTLPRGRTSPSRVATHSRLSPRQARCRWSGALLLMWRSVGQGRYTVRCGRPRSSAACDGASADCWSAAPTAVARSRIYLLESYARRGSSSSRSRSTSSQGQPFARSPARGASAWRPRRQADDIAQRRGRGRGTTSAAVGTPGEGLGRRRLRSPARRRPLSGLTHAAVNATAATRFRTARSGGAT
jgi:hypothetical protein